MAADPCWLNRTAKNLRISILNPINSSHKAIFLLGGILKQILV